MSDSKSDREEHQNGLELRVKLMDKVAMLPPVVLYNSIPTLAQIIMESNPKLLSDLLFNSKNFKTVPVSALRKMNKEIQTQIELLGINTTSYVYF